MTIHRAIAEHAASRETFSSAETLADPLCPACKHILLHIGNDWNCVPCKVTFGREFVPVRMFSGEENVKRWARILATQAKRSGKLKIQPCEKCGTTRSQMHHEDYSRPLEIKWLCRDCHMEEHREESMSLIEAQIEMKLAGRRKQVRHGGTLCSKCLINPPRPKARYCRTCKNADDKQRRDAKKNLHTPAEQTDE